MGAEVTIYTDHNPLLNLHSANLGTIEQRWVAKLSCFNYTIKHKRGCNNANADALSRYPHVLTNSGDADEDEMIAYAMQLEAAQGSETFPGYTMLYWTARPGNYTGTNTRAAIQEQLYKGIAIRGSNTGAAIQGQIYMSAIQRQLYSDSYTRATILGSWTVQLFRGSFTKVAIRGSNTRATIRTAIQGQ
ncbi:hypothetical protein BSL78_11360 [Apostichopus japonicus]|uniref:Reverse transcriptase RNase H-like domain-containing protein n=1 Tax=Stichopus japonicus TaxID=307972 RepID=A0A2G8KV33_STIJA|nr:hypothetical protein BSL78_11360 [Apostichopus japonicus]